MTLSRPDLLWFAIFLPALVTAAIFGYYRRRRVARVLGDLGLIRRIGGAGLDRFPIRCLLLLAPAALLIGLAAAGPQWGTERVETGGRSLNLVLALDVSKSMLARDLEPNRLERQRLFATRLLHELRGDRIGLVVFAGRAYTLAPLTTDHSALQLFIDALDPEIVSQGGSSLASAITQAVELVRGDQPTRHDRVVILISDGEALEDESAVTAAVGRATSHGVILHTVGIGTTAGAPVPEQDMSGVITGYKRDPDSGEIVISRLDEGLLERSARATGGRYTPADRAGMTDALLAEVRGLHREAAAGGTREVPRARFAWFIAIALALVALDSALARRAAGSAAPTGLGALDLGANHDRTHLPAGRHPGRGGAPFSGASSALAILVLATVAFGIGDLERGNRLYRQGRYAEAVEAYQSALRGGTDSPMLHYNLGTALLRLGRHQEAEEHLRAALASIDPEERERTLYNLGNRYLDAGINAADPRARDQMLDAATNAYRDALRLDPDDNDAKWTLELTRRERENPPPSSGAGQQQQDPRGEDDPASGQQDDQQGMMPPPGGNQDPGAAEPRDPGELSRAEAERLLNALEQSERELQRSKLRKGRRDTPVARDW
jgi:Ca-activated chloride channel family protein